ncbi:MAG: DUF819 family protein [Cyclobacteriaceae bacterium]
MGFLDSPLFVLTILFFNIFLSIYLERNTPLKHIGAALLAIIITAVTANIGLIPSASNPSIVYDHIFTYIAPASIFLLLLGVNLKDLKVAGRPMLVLFLIGSLGTCVGVFVASSLVGSEFGPLASPIAGMITGTYTGGSLNFNAIAIHYNMMEEGVLYTSIVAVDNILSAGWMAVTIAMPLVLNRLVKRKRTVQTTSSLDDEYEASSLSIYSISILIFVTCAVMVFSNWIGTLSSVPSILIVTTIALGLAQLKFFQGLKESKILGLFSIYLFLSVVGAFCELSALSGAGEIVIYVLIYLCLVIFVHVLITIFFGWLLKYDWEMVSVASQANVGGSSSALALARSLKRDDLLLAAVLIGSLGNAIGTYLGFLMVRI